MNQIELKEKAFQFRCIASNEKMVWGMLSYFGVIVSIEKATGKGEIIMLPERYWD